MILNMITVIIPAYNCSLTLERTLASLVCQTDPNFKVLVVDDCSVEDISQIIKEYSTKLNLRYIRHDDNVGCGMTRQTGIDNVDTSYFTFLDSDDVFMPFAIEIFNAFIAANPNTEYIHSYIYEQTETPEGVPVYLLHKTKFDYCHGKVYNTNLIKKFGIRNHPSVKWADDSFFNSMCSELLKLDIIQQPMMIWINNKSSITRKEDEYREKMKIKDFISAMLISCEFVSQYKEHINHVSVTIDNINKKILPNTEEAELLQQLSNYL